MESLAAENKRLQEEIARLEKEKESEPVSKLCLYFYGGVEFYIIDHFWMKMMHNKWKIIFSALRFLQTIPL